MPFSGAWRKKPASPRPLARRSISSILCLRSSTSLVNSSSLCFIACSSCFRISSFLASDLALLCTSKTTAAPATIKTKSSPRRSAADWTALSSFKGRIATLDS
uniref:OPA3-like protein isoform X2 n=1 Tax=Rhizophora mucronata TaxID=61149 RepID=A0A2P2JCM8_RHIMU